MSLANQQAQRSKNRYILPEHILIGLLKNGSGTGFTVLKNLGVDTEKMRLKVEKLLESGLENIYTAEQPKIPRARQVIEHALEEAKSLQHDYVGTEHILLGLLRQREGTTAEVFTKLGLKSEDVRLEIINVSGMQSDKGDINHSMPELT